MRASAMKSRENIYKRVVEIMVELFELDPESISEDSHLYEELDIDSIDAVDLIVELKSYTGKRISPDEFKNVRTVDDIVNAVHELLEHG